MSEDIETELAGLRAAYMTGNALKQYLDVAEVNAADGYPGYDLLVGNWDFDYPWDRSVEISKKEDHVHGFPYDAEGKAVTMNLSVENVGSRFRIGSVMNN